MTGNPEARKRYARSKAGCTTCRTRKLKCDETRPLCERCSKARLKCGWNKPGRRAPEQPTTPRQLMPVIAIAATTASSSSTTTTAAAAQPSPASTQSVASDHDQLTYASAPAVLSPAHIPLSNSLRLTPQDQEAFLFVRDSVLVLRFGKPFQWSTLAYIYHNIADKYAGVMRMFIAGSCMDLRSKALLHYRDGLSSSSSSSDLLDHARQLEHSATSHYHLALKDMTTLIEHISSSGAATDDDVDALFSMWFLILHFGLCDSHSTGASHVHLEGIRTFLKPYLKSCQEQGKVALPLVSRQLLYYLSYLDIYLALGSGSITSGRLWMDLLAEDADSPFSYDALFYSARSCLPKLWGRQYPASELLDDMDNYRPLHFLHLCQKPKLGILNLSTNSSLGLGHNDDQARRQLWTDITRLGNEFADVLALADKVPNSGSRRMIWTVYHAALDFYALKVLYSCLDPDDKDPPWLGRVVATATSIAHKAISEDPRQVYRLIWPLTISMIRTKDMIHRDWLKEQLSRARVFLPSFGVLSPDEWENSGLLGQLLLEADRACHSGDE